MLGMRKRGGNELASGGNVLISGANDSVSSVNDLVSGGHKKHKDLLPCGNHLVSCSHN